MRGTYAALMQSKFFTPAFNSAIFDGPLRIYFSQAHESVALKVYFSFQQKYPVEFAKAKERYNQSGQLLLLMIYPTLESFQTSFSQNSSMSLGSQLGQDELYGDSVMGVQGALEDSDLLQLLDGMCKQLELSAHLPPHRPLSVVPDAVL